MRAVGHFNDPLFLYFALATAAASIEQILALRGVCVWFGVDHSTRAAVRCSSMGLV